MPLSSKVTPDKSNPSLTITLENFEALLAVIVAEAESSEPKFMNHYHGELDGLVFLVLSSNSSPEFLTAACSARHKVCTLFRCGGQK